MFAGDLLIPILMIVGGRMMWKHPPKSVNELIGYRTARSMKNTDTWEFAQNHCGRLWWKIGLVMLIPSGLIHIPFYNCSENTIRALGGILCTVQIIVLVVSIFPTEMALKNTFTDEGIRR